MLHMAPGLFVTKSFTKETMAKYFNYIKAWFDTPKNEWSVLKMCVGININISGSVDAVVNEREPTLCDVLVLRLMNPPDAVIVEYSILGEAQPQAHDVLRPDKDFDLPSVGQAINNFFTCYSRRFVPTDAPVWSTLSAEDKVKHKDEYAMRSLEFYRKVRDDEETRKWFTDNWESEKMLCDASDILRQCSKIKVEEIKFRELVLNFMGDNKFLQILHDYYDNPDKYNQAWLVQKDDEDKDDKDDDVGETMDALFDDDGAYGDNNYGTPTGGDNDGGAAADGDNDGGADADGDNNGGVGARIANLFKKKK